MADFSQVGPVAALAAGSMVPLVLTLAPVELVALGAGSALIAALCRMTFADGALSKGAEKIEAAAADRVVMTSSGNRLARLLLGSLYLYAAVTFASRWTGGSALQQLLALEVGAVGKTALVWSGCLVDCYCAGIWLSTGADGQ
jgi:hypothetical protein